MRVKPLQDAWHKVRVRSKCPLEVALGPTITKATGVGAGVGLTRREASAWVFQRKKILAVFQSQTPPGRGAEGRGGHRIPLESRCQHCGSCLSHGAPPLATLSDATPPVPRDKGSTGAEPTSYLEPRCVRARGRVEAASVLIQPSGFNPRGHWPRPQGRRPRSGREMPRAAVMTWLVWKDFGGLGPCPRQGFPHHSANPHGGSSLFKRAWRGPQLSVSCWHSGAHIVSDTSPGRRGGGLEILLAGVGLPSPSRVPRGPGRTDNGGRDVNLFPLTQHGDQGSHGCGA